MIDAQRISDARECLDTARVDYERSCREDHRAKTPATTSERAAALVQLHLAPRWLSELIARRYGL